MSFHVTKEAVLEMLDDDASLQTLTNQMSLDEIWGLLEGKEKISSENELFEALMDVMYATRPKGVL
jgi:hypothetical protein